MTPLILRAAKIWGEIMATVTSLIVSSSVHPLPVALTTAGRR